jgi:anthranilate phosphoribosyltransferase
MIAQVLNNLGSKRAFVVRGEDGLDEITLTTVTKITELKDGSIQSYTMQPEDFGFKRCVPDDLKGGDGAENAAIILDIFNGKGGAKRDIVILNAAAAIVAGGGAERLDEGVAIARGVIDQGLALEKVEALKEMTNR